MSPEGELAELDQASLEFLHFAPQPLHLIPPLAVLTASHNVPTAGLALALVSRIAWLKWVFAPPRHLTSLEQLIDFSVVALQDPLSQHWLPTKPEASSSLSFFFFFRCFSPSFVASCLVL
jgi:hypothetical protein